ncbi:MAG TPA: DUF2911 domain-containing protein [Vicinamibacteria bacterium]
MLHRAPVVVSCLALAAASAFAQGNPRGEAKLKLAGKSIAIDYGRPSLKGRDMLGQAQVGQDWRMGADAATTLTTDADLTFGRVQVPKGTYTLKARKTGADQWALTFWRGDKLVGEVPLEGTKLPESVEVFTINLAEDKGQGVFRMSWGERALTARFTAK